MSNRRRALGCAVASAVMAGALSAPAFGEAPIGSKITAVPDSGIRPVAAGDPGLPTGLLALPKAPPVAPVDVLQAQIDALTAETRVMEAALAALTQRHGDAREAKTLADQRWRGAADRLREARSDAREAAGQAYLAAGELPPGMGYGATLRGLDALLPGRGGNRGVDEAAAMELGRALAGEQRAFAVLTEATDAERAAAAEFTAADTVYRQRTTALVELNKRMADLMSAAERKRDADAQISAYDVGKSNNGLIAHPSAQQAVRFALAQRGKPYRWGDEGPDTYDCSGLTLASYLSAGVRINRVANDQYNGTRSKPVSISAASMLPGDLIFFAQNPADWRTISHMGMYIGDGLMIHAPSTGDVVRVAPVRWNAVDFVTRVVDATPAPVTTTPPAPPSTSPSPSPSPSPSSSPSHSPSPSASPSTSPPPSSSPSPKVSTSTSPSPIA